MACTPPASGVANATLPAATTADRAAVAKENTLLCNALAAADCWACVPDDGAGGEGLAPVAAAASGDALADVVAAGAAAAALLARERAPPAAATGAAATGPVAALPASTAAVPSVAAVAGLSPTAPVDGLDSACFASCFWSCTASLCCRTANIDCTALLPLLPASTTLRSNDCNDAAVVAAETDAEPAVVCPLAC